MPSVHPEGRQHRLQALEDALASRVIVLDGAMGTMLQDRHLTAADFGGPALEGCNENLVLTRPDIMLDIHRAYFEAGSDIVETNSFQSSKIVLAEFGLADRSYEISFAAAKLAREAAAEFSAPGRMRFVAGSMGPTTKAISISGGVTFAELMDSFQDQSKGLIDGGADLLLLETCNDTRTVKAGLLAISRLGRELGFRIPVIVSGTIEQMGTMLAGQPADAFYVSIAHA
ncbi:MAG: homocysteine S-methyltransferase family protein, partial [Acidobacteriaceae bacterium]|nr:homocysteine S-methyltransferase family protein [Acidobacteriaceae bacterium]